MLSQVATLELAGGPALIDRYDRARNVNFEIELSGLPLGDVTAAQWCADNALTGLRLAKQFPGAGEAEFACHQLGRDYRGLLRAQVTPTPNFPRVDAMVLDGNGVVVVSLSTVVARY